MAMMNNTFLRKLSAAKRVVLVGDVERLQRLCSDLSEEGVSVNVAAVFSQGALVPNVASQAYQGPVAEVVPYLKANPANVVLVTMYSLSEAQALQLVQHCSDSATAIFDCPMHVGMLWPKMQVSRFDGGIAIAPRSVAFDSLAVRCVKRLCDIVVSVLFLLTLFPFVALAALAASKFAKAGSTLVTAERINARGEKFMCWMFRTEPANEERTYGFGEILASTGLCCWPQVFSVLSGKMSIVGPQLHQLGMDEPDAGSFPLFVRRHRVKPGMVSWSRHAGEEATLAKRREMEMKYVREWSMWKDIRAVL